MNKATKQILVADDEPSITRLLKLNLEQTGDYGVAPLLFRADLEENSGWGVHPIAPPPARC